MTAATLDAALAYAARGWRVLPVHFDKTPMTEHGSRDATTDPGIIRGWSRTWPAMGLAIATGAESGLAVLDVDVDPAKGLYGFDDLADIAPAWPETPTAHTPRGGAHALFSWPAGGIRNSAGKLGKGLDVRGAGGYVVAPPGPGRFWDPHLGPDMPLAAVPEWMLAAPSVEAAPPVPRPRPTIAAKLSRYGEAALDAAVKRIVEAPAGQQETTLNGEAFAIGGLVAGGVIPAGLAIDSLKWAGHQMPSFDDRRPWNASDIDRKISDAFLAGQREPRGVPNGR